MLKYIPITFPDKLENNKLNFIVPIKFIKYDISCFYPNYYTRNTNIEKVVDNRE